MQVETAFKKTINVHHRLMPQTLPLASKNVTQLKLNHKTYAELLAFKKFYIHSNMKHRTVR